MWETCVATVRRDSSSRAAISGLDSPSSTNAAILISVAVRLSQPLLRPPVLGVRPAPDAVGAERGLQPGDVGGRAQRGVDLDGRGEGGPRLVAVVGVDEVPGGRLQRLGPQQRPAGVLVALRGRRAAGRRRGPAGRGSTARSPAGAGSPTRRRGRRRGPRGSARCSRSPVSAARRTASASRSSISSSSSVLPSNASVSAASASGSAPSCSRSRLRASASGPMSRCPIRSACGTAAARWRARRADLAAMEADHGGDAEIAAGRGGFLQVLGQALHLGQRVVPAPGLEEQLAQGAVRLRQPDRRADLVGELPRLPGRGQGLLVPVEVAQRDGLVDLQQQPQVGQGRIGLGHGQRPVEQRQRVGHAAPAPRSPASARAAPSPWPSCRPPPTPPPARWRRPGRPSRPRRGCCASARRARAAGRGAGPRSRARPAPGPAWPGTPRTRPPACGTAPASSAGPRADRARRRAPARGSPPARPRPGHRCGRGRRRAGWPASRAGPSRPGSWRRPG